MPTKRGRVSGAECTLANYGKRSSWITKGPCSENYAGLQSRGGRAATMRVSDEAIAEFRRLYKEEYGEELPDAEASEMAFRLTTLYELFAKRRLVPQASAGQDGCAP